MQLKNVLLCSSLLLTSHLSSNAQSFIPPNADFETGTTANWTYYRGTVAMGHVFTLASSSSSVTGLHTLMTGSGTDMYGGFPVVGHGVYSIKLSHDTADNNANAASYNIHVPATGTYELDYYYAAVLQGSAHVATEQSTMVISAVDSATGAPLPSGSVSLLPSSTGMLAATTGSDVKYKPWTNATINLAGYNGRTVIVKFTVSGCATSAHFGYGYADIAEVTMTSSLTAPSVFVAAGATINVFPNPTSGTLNIQWVGQHAGAATVEVRDVTGRIANTTALKMNAAGEAQINVDDLDNGIYFVSIRSEYINYTNKVVVQK